MSWDNKYSQRGKSAVEKNKKKLPLLALTMGLFLAGFCIWYFISGPQQVPFNPAQHGHFSKLKLHLEYENNQTKVTKTIFVDPRGKSSKISKMLGIQADNTVTENPDVKVTQHEGGLISLESSAVFATPATTNNEVTSFTIEAHRPTILPIAKQEILLSIIPDRGLGVFPTVTAKIRPSYDAKPEEFISLSPLDGALSYIPGTSSHTFSLMLNKTIFPGQQLIITGSWPSAPSAEP